MDEIILSSIKTKELITQISKQVSSIILGEIRNNQNSSNQQDQLLSAEEAAQFLNLKKTTIYTKVNKGELPVMKRNNRLYFSSSELLDYLKQGRKKSNSQIEEQVEEYLSTNKNLK